jgi:dihydrofolate synthase/folylpolyglutamate synthase
MGARDGSPTPRTTRPARGAGEGWSEARAERTLRSLELFGMRFGLERMRRMMTALGGAGGDRFPSYDTIQVLGTNGKSSTTRMTAAILERHGLRTGAYTSPHLVAYRERVMIDERELDPVSFSAAVARADRAAEQVNRTLQEGDHVTQFELLTAAALWEMARREVQVAVIEAGLGGRYDATSVVEPAVSVLTNVGLEHTRWLGPTITDIAEEKLAVVRPGATLVLGPGLAPEAEAVAARVAGERDARIVRPEPVPEGLRLRSRGAFQRRNFAVARAAAAAYLERAGIELDEEAVRDAAERTEIPGRLQVVGVDPLTVLDGAHNPDAVAALVATLEEVFAGRPPALVLGVLEDKDAAGMLRELMPVCARTWFTAPPSERALPPAALLSRARQLGFEDTVCEPRPERALAEARAWAAGEHRGVLATGSVYLVGELLRHGGGKQAGVLRDAEGLLR